jgi:hypothetical protein
MSISTTSRVLAMALLLLLVSHALPANAQTPEDEVRAVIDHLFDGMRAGDSTAVRPRSTKTRPSPLPLAVRARRCYGPARWTTL